MRKGTCHNCEYRHGGCEHPSVHYTGKLCRHWKLGGCFVCQHYKDEFTKEEVDAWFARGCECWFPSRCENFKRDWEKTINCVFDGEKEEYD